MLATHRTRHDYVRCDEPFWSFMNEMKIFLERLKDVCMISLRCGSVEVYGGHLEVIFV